MEVLSREWSLINELSQVGFHDVSISGSDGLFASHGHRLVVAACCPLLRDIFLQIEDDIHVILPDYSPTQVRLLVEYLYTGSIGTATEDEQNSVVELINILSTVTGQHLLKPPVSSASSPVLQTQASILAVPPDHAQLPVPARESVPADLLVPADNLAPSDPPDPRQSQLLEDNILETNLFDSPSLPEFTELQLMDTLPSISRRRRGLFNKPGSLSLLIKQDPYQLHCDICNIVFDCRATFKDHVNNHEKESRECDICNKVFKKVSSLKLHRLTHVRPFKCDQCDSAFGRKSNLIAHERMHKGERPFVCDLCGKDFPIHSSLLTHHKQSHSVKQWPCDLCKSVLVSKSQLAIHRRSHTKEKPWICDTCGKGFSTKQNMMDHTRLHNDVMGFQCVKCGLQFKWKASLVRHLMDHTGERPYPCSQCNMGFKTANSLKKHGLSVHSEIKQYSCQHCLARFSTSSGVYRHQKKNRCSALAVSEEVSRSETRLENKSQGLEKSGKEFISLLIHNHSTDDIDSAKVSVSIPLSQTQVTWI
ncbi:zinc finger protein 184 [Eurytemora carolleeae]|uniref:zinc finger protein 184 n=1 Tax=Eurytemora carolleeae TaxID=1294199 RepID=UPI000C766AFD|nr:zinc finger protein 184 [Eurytemora carolleeae]|eukprot:XP_023343462.1 zinc finger protein 184-like [Eurytemora affinis]